ncbi:ribbon-helix-helix protein, CopG family [Sphingomonas sp. PAMC 26617]|uniref:ribbon-helix-helix protein, CopG family n=1 Tax=Sphingomonas sp. PAMC 26617 TaxID=1112216 RepID=UPI0002890B2B|nr:ribbon-helix-helix protein, CopG family [Sphingomonas sp. PAMC 26617]
MTRILADLSDEDLRWLDQHAVEEGKSRAAILREAVSSYKAQKVQTVPAADWLEQGFGLWARHGMIVDPKDYERRRRAEWTRPWDDDYEEVRAESPDCFTPEDDRERAHYLELMRKAAADSKSAPDA